MYSCSFSLLCLILSSLLISCCINGTFWVVSCYCVMVLNILAHVQTLLLGYVFLFGCSHFSLKCSLYVIPVWTVYCSELSHMCWRTITIPSGPAHCCSKINGGYEQMWWGRQESRKIKFFAMLWLQNLHCSCSPFWKYIFWGKYLSGHLNPNIRFAPFWPALLNVLISVSALTTLFQGSRPGW